jgi:KUP system potassium uptake protein
MATPELGQKLSFKGILVALGLVFGDIGTSPIYVFKALIGTEQVSADLILGGLSCIFWTLLIITSFKYVYLALKADNHGEGGIFALYARVRHYRARWAIFPALIGCATLMADGVITPSISISAAVEGIHRISPDLPTMPIVLVIILALFLYQPFGSRIPGQFLGYIMFVWFAVIGSLGLAQIIDNPMIIKALNPAYAYNFVANYKGQLTGIGGFWLLGAVFLCTTGVEALYSDMGRCGKSNIRLTWLWVLPCLLLSYLGQGAWLLKYFSGAPLSAEVRSAGILFSMVPLEWVLPMVILAVVATIVVSQALITGIFTMVNEAIQLKLWFYMRTYHPNQMRGQVYMPEVNTFLMMGSLTAVLVFQKSENMVEAYGLAIIVDILMTSLLLLHFVHMRNHSFKHALLLGLIFVPLELVFFFTNLPKIIHGGWFTLLSAAVIFLAVLVFYWARQIRKRHTNFVPFEEQQPILLDLMKDETIPRYATNLVYFVLSDDPKLIDANVMYSICRKKPKRADIYWFIHVEIANSPYVKSYKVETLIEEKAFFVRLKFGFKIEHKVNKMFREIVHKMQMSSEVDEKSHYPSLRRYDLPADFKFMLLNSRISADDQLSSFDQFVVRAYRLLKKVSVPPTQNFGLELAHVEIETIPIKVAKSVEINLVREG